MGKPDGWKRDRDFVSQVSGATMVVQSGGAALPILPQNATHARASKTMTQKEMQETVKLEENNCDRRLAGGVLPCTIVFSRGSRPMVGGAAASSASSVSSPGKVLCAPRIGLSVTGDGGHVIGDGSGRIRRGRSRRG